MANAKKDAADKYGGYTFTAIGKPDATKTLTLLAKLAGEKFGVKVEIVSIRTKDDPNDTRLFKPVN